MVWALLSANYGIAQTTDFRARVTGKISTDIGKKINTALEYEHRFDKNLSAFDKAFFEPSVTYSLVKSVKIGAAYRIMLDQNKTQNFTIENQAGLFASYNPNFDDFDFKVRTALQYGFDDLTNVSNYGNQKFIGRTAFEIQYNWFGTKFTPYLSVELFVHLNNPNGAILNQSRIKAGTEYKFSKKAALNAYYMFEDEFNVAFPVDANVFGVGFSRKF